MAHIHYDPDYKPKNAKEWFEYRLPVFSFISKAVGPDHPTPRNLNYWWNFGSIAGLCLMLQIVTGLVLSMHYAANITLAFDSVETIMRSVNYGWLLRYMHAVGASMFFIAIYIHISRGLYYGSYKAPREVLWWTGIIIFLLLMATAFLGYVLPWGQMSFWGATVITSLFSAFPLIGDPIVHWLWGGFSVDNPTLNRFFSLHFVLPFVIVGVVIIHIWALHRFGSNNPLGIDAKSPQDMIPFHPYYTVKDCFGFGVFGIVFAWFVFFAPNSLGHPDNYIPANPMVTPAHIVPEWYFLPFYAILRAIPDKLMGVLAMFGSILILFALPWIDRSKVRSAAFRPIYKIMFWLFIANAILLGYAGAQVADWGQLVVFCAGSACEASRALLFTVPMPAGLAPWVPDISISRIAAFYYFFHFALLWYITSRGLEKPLPLPESISKAVTAGGH